MIKLSPTEMNKNLATLRWVSGLTQEAKLNFLIESVIAWTSPENLMKLHSHITDRKKVTINTKQLLDYIGKGDTHYKARFICSQRTSRSTRDYYELINT